MKGNDHYPHLVLIIILFFFLVDIRISGLETQKGIFVMTDHFLHLLVGFTVKDRNAKFADMQFEWIPSQATSKFNSGSSTKVSGPPRLSPEDIPDEFYPKYIWTELIQADSPYVKIPIEEVKISSVSRYISDLFSVLLGIFFL